MVQRVMFQIQRQESLTKWGHAEMNTTGKPTFFSQMSTVTRFIKVVNLALLSHENTPRFLYEGKFSQSHEGRALLLSTNKKAISVTLAHSGAWEIIMWFYSKQCNFLIPWFLFKGGKKSTLQKSCKGFPLKENVRDGDVGIYIYTHTHKLTYIVYIYVNIYTLNAFFVK